MTDRGDSGPTSKDDQHQETLRALLQWADDAVDYVSMPHLRPSPIVEGPAIAWGLSLRPHEKDDPLLTDDPKEELRRKEKWIDQINDVIRLFFHNDIPTPEVSAIRELELHKPIRDDESSDPEDKKSDTGQVRIESRHFPFVWNGIFGITSVETHTEYVKFLFVLSVAPSLDPRNDHYKEGAFGNDYTQQHGDIGQLLNPSHIRDTPEKRKLSDALNIIGRSDSENASTDVRAQANYAFEEIWTEFAKKLREIALKEDYAGGRDARRRLHDPDESLFPGEVLGSLQMVIASAAPDWRDWNPSDPVKFGWREPGEAADDIGKTISLDPQQAKDDVVTPAVEAYHVLHARRATIDQLFRQSADREFVANRVMSGRHIFLSSLGSTIATEMNRLKRKSDADPKSKSRGAGDNYVPPSRILLLLRSRPQPHVLGRLVERLHTLQTLRIMALTDYSKLTRIGSRLRSLGLRFDQKTSASPAENISDSNNVLIKIFEELQMLGKKVRGGLNYRVNRSNLYAKTFERRIAEMKCSDREVGEISGWQPYDEFIRRRLTHSFNYLADLSARRDRLFQRVSLLIERLQWHELNKVQRDTHDTMRSTDEIAYVAISVSMAAVGLSLGETAAALAPDYYAAIAPSYGGATPVADGTAADKYVFGAIAGFAVGIYVSAWLFIARSIRSSFDVSKRFRWWRSLALVTLLALLIGGLMGDKLMAIVAHWRPELASAMRDGLSALSLVEKDRDSIVGAVACGGLAAVGWAGVNLLYSGLRRGWRSLIGRR
ncbi:MAG: DUF3422 family protein [Neomegalonema sp.]|nr:DUF3422 family protein [Neomegalonema sp.]